MSDPQLDPIDIEVPWTVVAAEPLAPGTPAEDLALFLDAAVEHRDKAVARGFSPEAAEAMAVSLHSGLIAAYFTS